MDRPSSTFARVYVTARTAPLCRMGRVFGSAGMGRAAGLWPSCGPRQGNAPEAWPGNVLDSKQRARFFCLSFGFYLCVIGAITSFLPSHDLSPVSCVDPPRHRVLYVTCHWPQGTRLTHRSGGILPCANHPPPPAIGPVFAHEHSRSLEQLYPAVGLVICRPGRSGDQLAHVRPRGE